MNQLEAVAGVNEAEGCHKTDRSLNPIKKLMYVNEIKRVMSLAQTQIFISQSQPPSTLMPHAGSTIGAVACNH